MELFDYYQRRLKYEKLAQGSVSERLNRGDDSPYWARVDQEWLYDLDKRMAELEKILQPAPEHERE